MKPDDFCKNRVMADASLLGDDPESETYNRHELMEKFELVFDPVRFSTGYQWFCKKCKLPCFSEEVFFHCQNSFLTTKIVCGLGCQSKWVFKITRCEGRQQWVS